MLQSLSQQCSSTLLLPSNKLHQQVTSWPLQTASSKSPTTERNTKEDRYWLQGGGVAWHAGGRISNVSLRPKVVQKDKQNKAEEEKVCLSPSPCVCVCLCGRVSEKLHGKVQERTINTNLLPARWATSSQVGVVSIAVNAIYLMYWPITTSPLCAPAEGSPTVPQQGHRRTID